MALKLLALLHLISLRQSVAIGCNLRFSRQLLIAYRQRQREDVQTQVCFQHASRGWPVQTVDTCKIEFLFKGSPVWQGGYVECLRRIFRSALWP